MLPLRCSDLRAALNEEASASDASLSGGGFVSSDGLTRKGILEGTVLSMVGNLRPSKLTYVGQTERVLYISFFDGIGGGRRALELAGVNVEMYVSIEID